MAGTKPDRELSEAAFHSKYGFTAGWDEARAMVWSALQEHWGDERVRAVLRTLHGALDADERNSKRDAYVRRIDV